MRRREAAWFVAVAALSASLIGMMLAFVWGMLADSFMMLYSGRYHLEHGLPRVDTLSAEGYGRTWLNQQWLAHLIFHGLWRVGGYGLMMAAGAAMVGCAVAAMAVLLVRRGATLLPATLLTATVFVVVSNFAFVRAQLFGLVLWPVMLWLLLDQDRAPRPTWRIPALAVLVAAWANLHGSVLIAGATICVFGTFWIARAVLAGSRGEVVAYLAVVAIGLCGTLITPYGVETLHYYRSLLGNDTIERFNREWQTSGFDYGIDRLFYALLVATVILVGHGRWRRRIRLSPLLISTAVLAAAGIMAVRNHPWFALTAVVLINDALPERLRLPQVERRQPGVVSWIVVAASVAVAIAVGSVLAARSEDELVLYVSPPLVDCAAQELASDPDLQLLADPGTSAAMLWLEPRVSRRRIAFDARLDVFPQSRLRAYYEFLEGRTTAWRRLASEYHLIAVSAVSRRRLVQRVQDIPGFSRVQCDADGVLLRRGG